MTRRSLGRTAALVLVGLFLPLLTFAQTKYPVEVAHTGNDSVGTLYAFELREAIRGSNSMQLVNESFEPRIKVFVVSMDADTPDRGISSAIAITVLYDSLEVPLGGAHLTTILQICGRERVALCARSLLSRIDSQVTLLQERSQRLWKTLFRSR